MYNVISDFHACGKQGHSAYWHGDIGCPMCKLESELLSEREKVRELEAEVERLKGLYMRASSELGAEKAMRLLEQDGRAVTGGSEKTPPPPFWAKFSETSVSKERDFYSDPVHPGYPSEYLRGFRDCRERAAKVAESMKWDKEDADLIADAIRAIEPGE